MAGSEYYDDRDCVHGNNVGFYGSGCAICEEQDRKTKDNLDEARKYLFILSDLIGTYGKGLQLGVKTNKGWVRVNRKG